MILLGSLHDYLRNLGTYFVLIRCSSKFSGNILMLYGFNGYIDYIIINIYNIYKQGFKQLGLVSNIFSNQLKIVVNNKMLC